MSHEPPKDLVTVLNIMAASYSGSTWLNLMLGSHSQAFSVGELKSVLRHGRAVCKFHGDGCPVWKQFHWPDSRNPYLQIAELTGRHLLVVNNAPQFKHYLEDEQIRPLFLHLFRDGRAVAASQMRKYPRSTMWGAARHWGRQVGRIRRELGRLTAGQWMHICYERLVDDLAEQTQQVCAFVGVSFEPGMLQYWRHDHHFLGGNRGTLVSLAEQRGGALASTAPSLEAVGRRKPQLDLSFYRGQSLANFRDERWRTQLTPWQMWVFRVAAGRLHRRLGYAPLCVGPA